MKTLQFLFPLFLMFFALHCATNSDSASATGSTSTTQTCRTYPKSWTDTSNSVTYTCTYNGSTTVTCTNGGTETITYTYADRKTFVDEAASPVTVFNRRKFSTMVVGSATPSRQQNLTMAYNGSGQATSLTQVAATYSITYTFTAWDSNNRYTAGTAAFTAGGTCTGRVLSYTYVDGTTRSETVGTSGGTGPSCASLTVPATIQDANGNAIQMLGFNFTINSTETACY